MLSIRNLKDHDVSNATAILRQVIKTIVSKGLLYFTLDILVQLLVHKVYSFLILAFMDDIFLKLYICFIEDKECEENFAVTRLTLRPQ